MLTMPIHRLLNESLAELKRLRREATQPHHIARIDRAIEGIEQGKVKADEVVKYVIDMMIGGINFGKDNRDNKATKEPTDQPDDDKH